MESRPVWKIKIHALQRYLSWYYGIRDYGHVRIAEFPKSGGTWLGQMVSDVFQIPFPRNAPLVSEKCVQHEHYLGPPRRQTILMVRDVRDIYTSAYFHFLISEDGKPGGLINKWRKLMSAADIQDVKSSMPTFISAFSKNLTAGGRHLNWSEHVNSYLGSDKTLVIKYEDLLSDCETQLTEVCKFYNHTTDENLSQIVEKYSFEKQAKRKRGQEDQQHFLRKGISGDWKNYFNQESLDLVMSMHERELQTLGYD